MINDASTDEGDKNGSASPLRSAPAPARPPALHARVRVIHDDPVLLVLDKPPGILSHPNRTEEKSFKALFRARYDLEREAYFVEDTDGKTVQLYLVHRLDQETSGLIVLARRPQAASDLKEALYRREVHKEYRALVLGIPTPARGTWSDCLDKRDSGGQARVVVVSGRPNAVTEYDTVKVFAGARAALVRLDPETGRTHQLRVQTSSRGLPIAGDQRYGDAAANRTLETQIGLKRMFLHAYRLELRHPTTGHRLVLTAELRGPLADPLKKLEAVTAPLYTPSTRVRRGSSAGSGPSRGR